MRARLALLAFASSLTVFHVQSGDVLMYLSLARDFIFGALNGDLDPYLYPLANATLVWTHEWLSYVAFYGAWLLGGAAGLILLKAAVLTLTFQLILTADDEAPGGWWPALWVLGVTAASFRFVERGSLVSDLFLVILVRELVRAPALTRGLASRLALLFVAWAQLHPGYPTGLGFLLLWAVNRRSTSPWLALPVLAPLVNPAGPRGYLYPFRFALDEARTLKDFNFEWFPTYHPAFRFAPETLAYWTFALVALTLLLRAGRPRELRTWFAVAALALGVTAVRFVPAAVFTTLVCLKPWSAFGDLRWPRWATRIGYVALLALSLKNLALGYQSSSGPRRPGFGFDPAFFPTTNLELLRTHPIPGRLYNTQDFGASLIWAKLTPVFDHGFVTDMAFYRDEVVGTLSSGETFFRLAAKYRWTMLLVDKRGAYRAFYAHLKDHPEWRIVGEDDASYLIYRQP